MRAKIVILMIIIILFTIFVTQNTLVIPVDIFFWRVEMSVIVLISLCTLVGIMIGFFVIKIFDRPKEDEKTEQPETPDKDNGLRHIR
jgi:uncharacterized integral membrane protein